LNLPAYIDRTTIHQRLQLIFPSGIANRTYCTRELAASTIFTALYIGAVEGSGTYLAPKHVYRMTAEQAQEKSTAARQGYIATTIKPGFHVPGKRWYADNTREPIRDETLREGLVAIGAVLADEKVPTTSGKGRYVLKTSFAALFNPTLKDQALIDAIEIWQKTDLSKSALARVSILRSGAAGYASGVLVTFPSKETRNLSPGPSSIIARAVIEEFASRFLIVPAVLWLSESGNKVVARDDKLAAKIGLKIEADKNLPDIILADLGPADPLLVFVEVVATDGPITPRRQTALYALTDAADFPRPQVAFLTAYADRAAAAFKKTVAELAWQSFAWFVSEPECLVQLRDGTTRADKLDALISR
jgi:hypothetical protein